MVVVVAEESLAKVFPLALNEMGNMSRPWLVAWIPCLLVLMHHQPTSTTNWEYC